MLGKKLYIAICISAIIHCTLLVAATYLAYRKSAGTLGGGSMGEVITVSVLSGDSSGELPSSSVEKKFAKKSEISRMAIPSPSRPSISKQTPSADVAMHSAETTRDEHSTGSGTGKKVGPGSGSGKRQLSRIWAKINRSKYYPLHARRNLWEGKPRITFKIGDEGQIEFVHLTQSCGITMLDDAAIETIRRSAPLPHYPKPITLTIRYSLRE